MQSLSSPDKPDTIDESRKAFLHKLFLDVMARVDVRRTLRECFIVTGDTLQLGEDRFDLRQFSSVKLLAVGKAAVPMAEHALEVLSPHIGIEGVVTGVGRWTPPSGIQFFSGGHPIPDEHSFAAGQALLQSARSADKQTLALFLISGGASAMAEAPLDASLIEEEIATFYQWLIHSGLTIRQVNALRKHISALKGGRLAVASGMAVRATVLLSDVPPGMLDVIGSGPSLPDSSTVDECRRILAATDASATLSPVLKAFTARMPETPKELPEGRFPSTCFSALSSDSLIEAARTLAAAAGYRVVVDNSCDDWEYAAAASYLVDRAMEELSRGGPVCVLSAGEVTVSIVGNAGIGGRNQQWALAAARRIAGLSGFTALSAGSDGMDGNSPAAGAIVDSQTWAKAEQMGLDAASALANFAAYPLFERLGDALTIGPSGNNLRDLRVILAG